MDLYDLFKWPDFFVDFPYYAFRSYNIDPQIPG